MSLAGPLLLYNTLHLDFISGVCSLLIMCQCLRRGEFVTSFGQFSSPVSIVVDDGLYVWATVLQTSTACHRECMANSYSF